MQRPQQYFLFTQDFTFRRRESGTHLAECLTLMLRDIIDFQRFPDVHELIKISRYLY